MSNLHFRFFKNEITSKRMLIGLILITKFTYSQENLSCVCRNVTYGPPSVAIKTVRVNSVSSENRKNCSKYNLDC